MTMQAGAIKYTPTNNNGNWTVLCQIPQMAKAIDEGASVKDVAGTTIPNAAYITKVWTGTEPVSGLDKVYPGQTTYNAAKLNTPLYMTGTSYFTKSADWYKNGLPTSATGASTGGMAPTTYTGNGNDYLDSYFRTGLQTTSSSASQAGSTSGSANAQILKKTSAYWVAVTHAMYNLDMAAVNLARTGTNSSSNLADAKANFDSVAAALYGCGETNPVPLPLGPNGTPIKYATVPGSPDTGLSAVTMSVYGLANKRAANYNQFTLRSTTSSTACTVAGTTCKNVATLNVLISDALNAGPTTASINQIRDAVLTLFTQASQRYIAKMTLAAHLPGNGMGGSTNPGSAITTPTTNPTTGTFSGPYSGGTPNGFQATACGGANSYIQPIACTANNHGAACTANAIGADAGMTGADTACPTATTAAGGTPLLGTCVNGQVSGINACSAGSPGASGVVVAGSVDSNTLTFGAVMPAVKQNPSGATQATIATAQAAAVGPFEIVCTGAGTTGAAGAGAGGVANAASGTCGTAAGSCMFTRVGGAVPAANAADATNGIGCNGVTNQQIQRAVRGMTSNSVTGIGAAPSTTATPVACIDKSVCFNDVRVNNAGNGRASSRCARLCDPGGAPAIPGTGVASFALRKAAYAAQTITDAGSNSATAAGGSVGAAYWDPITAAQASLGGFCCDAAYYSTDGVGRDAAGYGTLATVAAATTSTGTQDLSTTGFVPNNQFTPVQVTGESMEAEVSPGVMCPVSSTGGTKGVSEFENPEQVFQLEGQAFYACMAGIQRSIFSPVGVTKTVQDANAARQKKCSETITKMMKMNLGVDASTATTGLGPGGAVCAIQDALASSQTTTAQFCRGTDKSAIQFPTWSVGIGDGTTATVTKYNVPNGYCYANACFNNLAGVSTETVFSGVAKLGTLVSSPDMGSNPTTATKACGRANSACAVPPSGWTGGEVVVEKCSKGALATGNTGCDTADISKQLGVIPTV